MKLKLFFIINVAIIAGMLVLSIWTWVQLPPDSQVPVHFNLAGVADRYMGKEGLLLLPLLTFIIILIQLILPKIEPKRQNLHRSHQAYAAFSVAIVAFLSSVHIVIVLSALGKTVNINAVIGVALGLFLIVTGNYFGKIRPNHFFGLRTPWTLSSDLAWHKTNRLSGWLTVLHGVAFVVSGLLSNGIMLVSSAISLTIVSLVVLPIYSYFLWKCDPNHSTS